MEARIVHENKMRPAPVDGESPESRDSCTLAERPTHGLQEPRCTPSYGLRRQSEKVLYKWAEMLPVEKKAARYGA